MAGLSGRTVNYQVGIMLCISSTLKELCHDKQNDKVFGPPFQVLSTPESSPCSHGSRRQAVVLVNDRCYDKRPQS